MPAMKHKLKIEQGTSWRKPFVRTLDGAAVDLSGWTARMQIREKVDAATVVLELTTENGGIEIDPLIGGITLVFQPSDTSGQSWRTGVYDVELIDIYGNVTRILYGSVTLSPEVTR